MSTNPVYDAIEDELVRCLEQGAKLPPQFLITLAEDEYLALIAGGLTNPKTKIRVSHQTTRMTLRLAGYLVTVRSEKDPEDWPSQETC